MTVTTVADLIESTRRHLFTSYRAEFNFLTDTITAAATTLALDISPLTGVGRGTVLGIGDELLFVKSVSTQTCTVARGWQGTTAAAHTSGATVEINPRFPNAIIRDAIRDEIRSWGNQLYRVDSYPITATTDTAYDLPIDPFIQVLDVRRSSTADERWKRVTLYEVDRHANTTSFPSGCALQIQQDIPTGSTIQVTYSAPFDLTYIEDGIEAVEDIGLAESMLDIPPYGAAWRLLSTREVPRTFADAQPEARRSEEVPPGHNDRTAAGLKRIRDQRLAEETSRLIAKTAVRW
jgi:hypothetical protein